MVNLHCIFFCDILSLVKLWEFFYGVRCFFVNESLFILKELLLHYCGLYKQLSTIQVFFLQKFNLFLPKHAVRIVMRSRVYETVLRPSVCLSISLGICGGFAAVGPESTRYRPVASRSAAAGVRQANVGSATLSVDVGSWTQTCLGSVGMTKVSCLVYSQKFSLSCMVDDMLTKVLFRSNSIELRQHDYSYICHD